jgi:hypothetical protein
MLIILILRANKNKCRSEKIGEAPAEKEKAIEQHHQL